MSNLRNVWYVAGWTGELAAPAACWRVRSATNPWCCSATGKARRMRSSSAARSGSRPCRWESSATGLNGLTGRPRKEAIKVPQLHLFTQASNDKTIYFYSMAFPKARGEWAEEAAQRDMQALRAPLESEDKSMVEAQQRAMCGRTFCDMKPVLLDVDAPAGRARRVLEQILAAEAAAID